MLVGALVGHTDHATTLCYAHLETDPVAAAAENIGALLRQSAAGDLLIGRRTWHRRRPA